MGIKGEPTTPNDPAQGKVWTSILRGIGQTEYEDQFVSVDDKARKLYGQHPWTLSGGGAVELKEKIESKADITLGQVADSIGITSFTLEDELFILPLAAAKRAGIASNRLRPMVVGDAIRDWRLDEVEVAVFPYNEDFEPLPENPSARPEKRGRGRKKSA